MKIMNTPIRAEISEPWDEYKVINAKIIRYGKLCNDGDCLLIREDLTNDIYALLPRYNKDKIDLIFKKECLIVNIAKLKNPKLIMNIPYRTEDFIFKGIGSAKIITTK